MNRKFLLNLIIKLNIFFMWTQSVLGFISMKISMESYLIKMIIMYPSVKMALASNMKAIKRHRWAFTLQEKKSENHYLIFMVKQPTL